MYAPATANASVAASVAASAAAGAARRSRAMALPFVNRETELELNANIAK
jgi:hypothetical protein